MCFYRFWGLPFSAQDRRDLFGFQLFFLHCTQENCKVEVMIEIRCLMQEEHEDNPSQLHRLHDDLCKKKNMSLANWRKLSLSPRELFEWLLRQPSKWVGHDVMPARALLTCLLRLHTCQLRNCFFFNSSLSLGLGLVVLTLFVFFDFRWSRDRCR